MHVFSDDIGSYPLPPGGDKEELRRIAFDVACKRASSAEKERLDSAVSGIMAEKLSSGVLRPTYPQIQDMISGFSSLFESFHEKDEPWVVRKEYAVIPELSGAEQAARKAFEDTGRKVELRVCVTGPLELYLKRAGLQVQGDLLLNIAKSVSRFVESAVLKKKHIETVVVSLDEPSLGLNPNVLVGREDLISAWEAAIKPAGKLDVQLHLHSPNAVDIAYETEGINVIGVESAGDPKALEAFDRSDLESCDKFLRVGVAKTNIYSIMSDSGVEDQWKDPTAVVGRLESKDVIRKRLEHAYSLFGGRVKYAGPDCGLGGWPDQKSAFVLLKNAAEAIKEFNMEVV